MSVAIEGPQRRLRLMRRTDIPSVRRTEVACYQFPWSEQDIEEICFQRSQHSLWRRGPRGFMLGARHGWVLTEGRRLIGHAIMSIEECGAHIMNICVHPQRQGFGLGRTMLSSLLRIARRGSMKRVYLEVRPTNVRAQHLYFAAGFRKVGLRRDFYPTLDGREDAWVLSCRLDADSDARVGRGRRDAMTVLHRSTDVVQDARARVAGRPADLDQDGGKPTGPIGGLACRLVRRVGNIAHHLRLDERRPA